MKKKGTIHLEKYKMLSTELYITQSNLTLYHNNDIILKLSRLYNNQGNKYKIIYQNNIIAVASIYPNDSILARIDDEDFQMDTTCTEDEWESVAFQTSLVYNNHAASVLLVADYMSDITKNEPKHLLQLYTRPDWEQNDFGAIRVCINYLMT